MITASKWALNIYNFRLVQITLKINQAISCNENDTRLYQNNNYFYSKNSVSLNYLILSPKSH